MSMIMPMPLQITTLKGGPENYEAIVSVLCSWSKYLEQLIQAQLMKGFRIKFALANSHIKLSTIKLPVSEGLCDSSLEQSQYLAREKYRKIIL